MGAKACYSDYVKQKCSIHICSNFVHGHKKEMNFFKSDFCDCSLAAHRRTACAVHSSQPMQVEKMIKLLSLVSRWWQKWKLNKCKNSTNRCNISHSGALECCRLKPTTYVAGIVGINPITVPFQLICPRVWPVTRWTKFWQHPTFVWLGTGSKS